MTTKVKPTVEGWVEKILKEFPEYTFEGLDDIDSHNAIPWLTEIVKNIQSHSVQEAKAGVIQKIEDLKCKVPKKPKLDADDDESLNKAFKYVGRYNYNKSLEDLLSTLNTKETLKQEEELTDQEGRGR